MEQHACDVLIVGAGGAALRSAIAAHDKGARVILTVKDTLGCGATGYRVSEMAAYNVADGVADPGDSPEIFHRDIMDAAMGMADSETARIVAENSIDSLRQLLDWGVKFEMDGNRLYAYRACFSSKPRAHVIKGHGDPVIEATVRQLRRRAIETHEHMTVVGLVVADGVCAGAVAIDREGGFRLFSAKAVVMATGGASQMFQRNMNPGDVTGDGCAMAHRAGAELVNLEFMQAGLGFVYPAVSLINAYNWGGYPILTNADGVRFMDSLPDGVTAKEAMDEHRAHFPFSSRDASRYLEVSIQREIAEGRGSEHGGVYADFTMMTDDYVRGLGNEFGVHHMWPLAKEYFYQKGIRLLEETVEVGCFAHAFNGGIRINAKAGSSLPGLFAAGETSGGAHGADRLGGNMMVTCQVFGKVAGESAARFAASGTARPAEAQEGRAALAALEPKLRAEFDAPALKAGLGKATQRNLLVRRTGEGLESLLREIEDMENIVAGAGTAGKPNFRKLEVDNLLLVARLTTQSALRRRESRGSHYREDFPKTDENLATPFVVAPVSRPKNGGNS